MTNEELVRLVTEAFDAGFREGFLFSDYGGYEDETVGRLTDLEYLARRDEWVRVRVPEGTTL